MTSTIAVTSAANWANSLVGICCGPSDSACSGCGMRLDDDPVGADRDGRARERQHEVAPPRRVRGVDDHRQVRLLLEHRDRAQVERVPRRRLEGPDPALAEDDLLVPLLGDVLGRHQELLHRGRRPALEENRLVGPADLGQQQEVLAVARADLDHVGRLDDGLDVPRVHELGHDRAARSRRRPRAGSRAPPGRAPGTCRATCAA